MPEPLIDSIDLSSETFPFQPPTPSVRASLILYALGCLLLLVFGTLLQHWHLVIGLLVTELVFVAAPPILYARHFRYPLAPTFALTRISGRTALLTVLASASGFVLIGALTALQETVFPRSAEYQDLWNQVLQQFHELPLWVAIGVIALLPGVCEELLFRGFLLHSLRRAYSKHTAIVITAVLFGAFHFDLYRFVSTTLLGLLFGYVVVRTGSIAAGMIAHGTNNALAIVMADVALSLQPRYPELFRPPAPGEPPSALLLIVGSMGLISVLVAPILLVLTLRALPMPVESAMKN